MERESRKVMERRKIKPSLRTFQGREKELVCALSHHREILRRETTFLRREITSRRLATISGKKDYLESRSEGKGAPMHLVHGLSQRMDSGTFDLLKVPLPYLVNNEDEALGFMLHDLENLCYRIKSFASILKEFSIPIPLEKVRLLHLMARSFLSISNAIGYDTKQHPYEEHRMGWTSSWGCEINKFGSFDDTTTLSPMLFTHCTPGIFPFGSTAGTALQIYSFKIVELNCDLNWPIYVYGVVAARDTVDRNRNLLFCRSRDNCQELNQDGPFLCLTGPSRAILAEKPVSFEVELMIKYGTESQDIAVFNSVSTYHSNYHTASFPSGICTAELSLGKVARAVQATIVNVCVDEGPWPFEYGARVACSFSATESRETIDPLSREVVLLDVHGEEFSDNYHFQLSRNVVSVQVQGTLRVAIKAYTPSGNVAQQSHVDFTAKYCQTSTGQCFFGNSKVKIIVAWSLFVKERLDLLMDGYLA